MKTIECYKVTIGNKSVLAREHSCLTENCFCRFAVSYKIGEVTYPKLGLLYCLELYEQAYQFSILYGERQIQIFKGIGTNPKRLKLNCYTYEDIEHFWKKKLAKKKIDPYEIPLTAQLPKGTICVDSFEPKELLFERNSLYEE